MMRTYAAQLEQPSLVVCGGVLTKWCGHAANYLATKVEAQPGGSCTMVEARHLTSAGALDLLLVSDEKPRGRWSAESSFKSALIQQHMPVLQYFTFIAWQHTVQ